MTRARRTLCERESRVERILVVDDEKSILFALRQYFMRQGYTVDCTPTGEQALELLSANQYAVAIVDVELRGSGNYADGLNLAEFIRRHAPETAVIVLTALETADMQERARAAGVASYLRKPTPLAALASLAFSLIR